MMREVEVDGNISSIITKLLELFPDTSELWFRGQPDYKFNLVPSMFRQGIEFDNQSYDEAGMYYEFIRRYPEHSTSHRTIYEWLTLMQHYGLPTRLLDWTANLLVALYFSCDIDTNGNADGSLFILDPTSLIQDYQHGNFEKKPTDNNTLIELQVISKGINDFYHKLIFDFNSDTKDDVKINGHSISEIKSDPFLMIKFTHISKAESTPFNSYEIKHFLGKPTMDISTGQIFDHCYCNFIKTFMNIIALKTPLLNPRIKAQQGLFTIHGGKYFKGKEFIKYEPMEFHPYLTENNLTKIKIKASDKLSIMHELKLSGIREASLFPEMDYQAKEIKNLFMS